MPSLKTNTPNVAVPSGALYPNGVEFDPPDPSVQATTRPEGAIFRSSPGYSSIRPGRFRLAPGHPHGPGIHFTPQRFAEDVGELGPGGYPLMVDKARAADFADVADLPGSERLDDNGAISASDAAQNRGVKLSEGTDSPTGGADVRESEKTIPDMGDRSPGRPFTRSFWNATLHNPINVFQDEYRSNPVMAIGLAGVFVGLAYALGTEFERAWTRRSSGRGAVGAAGTAPAAAVESTGASVKEATSVVNDSVTAAGDAVETAVSAAGDAVEAAGTAAEKATKAAADAATD